MLLEDEELEQEIIAANEVIDGQATARKSWMMNT